MKTIAAEVSLASGEEDGFAAPGRCVMLSIRLVHMIEDHAEELTRGLIKELQTDPRTPHYHRLTYEELHYRTYSVYHNLGQWLNRKNEEPVEASYTDLAKRRFGEGVPLHEIVFSLISTKNHLRNYVHSAGLMDSAVELNQERELHRLVDRFFDEAIYHTVRAYERQAEFPHVHAAAHTAAS